MAAASLLLAGLLVLPAPAAGQDRDEDRAHVRQAASPEKATGETAVTSKVYFPDAITPESVAAARKRAAMQEQVTAENPDQDTTPKFEQIARSGEPSDPLTQLTDPSSLRELAQLSEAERQVLLEAIEGTDICDDPPAVEAIRALCRNRIETRSSEFATRQFNTLSAEQKLLGEALEDTGAPAIERVIERLARNSGRAQSFEDQAVASIALGSPADSGSAVPDGADEAGRDLPPETQQFINALIQQLGDGGG